MDWGGCRRAGADPCAACRLNESLCKWASRCMLCLNPHAIEAGQTMNTSEKTRIVGAPVLRKEGVQKLLGQALYVDDIRARDDSRGNGAQHDPRGLIRSIHYDERIDWDAFTVVTAADIPGKNHIQLIFADQPCLADGVVNHCDEAIVLLAHADKHKLREAMAAVRIEYEALPGFLPLKKASGESRLCGEQTICSRAFFLKRAMSIRCGQCRARCRRRIPHGRAGASLH